MSIKLFGLLASTSVLLASTTSAKDAGSIFNKKNRTLSQPPRALKSTSENLDYRLESETDRLSRTPAQVVKPRDDETLNITTQPVTPTSPQKPSSYKSIQDSGSSSFDNRVSARRGRHSSNQSRHSFDGDRVFGVGIVAAGVYGIFGGELEFALDDQTSFALGMGTGMTYSTWGISGKYFFNQSGKLGTFFQAGYANWYMGKAPSSASESSSNYLAQRFFYDGSNVQQRKRVDLVYPALGVVGQFKSGLAITGSLQYLIAMHDFSGGLFGSLGMYFYF